MGRPKGKGSKVIRVPNPLVKQVEEMVYEYNEEGKIKTIHKMPC